MAGVRAQKRPKESRATVKGSIDQVTPARGDHLLFWSGMEPSRANCPFGRTWFSLRIGLSGLSSFSQRTPAVTVSFGVTNHWSWTKNASSFCEKAAVPAWSAVNPFKPPNWKYCVHLPASRFALTFPLKTYTPLQLPLKIWLMEVLLYSAPPLMTWFFVRYVTVSPKPTRSACEVIGRKLTLPKLKLP